MLPEVSRHGPPVGQRQDRERRLGIQNRRLARLRGKRLRPRVVCEDPNQVWYALPGVGGEPGSRVDELRLANVLGQVQFLRRVQRTCHATQTRVAPREALFPTL